MSTLGFDTSNYTTSVAICDKGEFVNSRKLLSVKSGERGLRQSDALFQHVKRLPEVLKQLGEIENITAVGVSTRPRSVDGSYMPVFLAGISFAETASAVLGVPLYKFSHQDGHIMAGIVSAGACELLDENFITVHISGGTTEILKCKYTGMGFLAEIVGGTKDISAGQVIDRVGVHYGLDFPCGKQLDILCDKAECPVKLPVSHKEGYFNFSGLETKTLSLDNISVSDVAAGVFAAISETLCESIDYCCKTNNIQKVLVVGGVASSKYIRNYLTEHSKNKFYFGSVELSSDNACGIAALAELSMNGGNYYFRD